MASTLRSMSGPIVPHGRAGVGEKPEVASHRSSAVTANGTVRRQGRTRRAAGAAVQNCLPAVWWGNERPRQATFPGHRCATVSQRDATTSCTVLMAAMKGTAPCASQGPSIVTVTGQCVYNLFKHERCLIYVLSAYR